MKHQHPHQRAARRGVSMIEAVASMVILAVAMAASINTIAAARASQVMASEHAKTRVLAESILTEVLAHPYAEPGTTTLGPDAGESSGNLRTGFDDIDDFDEWDAPLAAADGTPIPGFDGYNLRITVDWLDPDEPKVIVHQDLGLKRVTVRIFRNGRRVARVRTWATTP